MVDNSEPSDEVRIGSTVVIQEEGEDFDEEYRIVGTAEANPRERKISEQRAQLARHCSAKVLAKR